MGLTTPLVLRALYQPKEVCAQLVAEDSPPILALFRYPLLLMLLPPLFAFVGATLFGWRLGAAEPLYLDLTSRIVVSFAYFLAICFGFVTSVVISMWMASTYGANRSAEAHIALLTVVSAPLALASVIHLYPHVFINVLVMIPAISWSMALLYRTLPAVLDTPPKRGMLMASSIVAWLLVGAVSLLGMTAMLWSLGIGTNVRI